jgi:diguanylate cyclase (GGDEF)-like protein
VGLILLSGDELGKINETQGRDAGDQVLRSLSDLLRSILKGEELLGHIDGTHFAVALYPAFLAAVRERGEDLRRQVEAQALPCGESTARITISVGVMSIPSLGEEEPRVVAEAAFDRLNGALYAAKRAGGNRVEAIGE